MASNSDWFLSCPEKLASFEELVLRYEALLFDAYGVLVNETGACPGAKEALLYSLESRKAFLVITNDASKSPERTADRFKKLGLPISAEQIITSGMLLAEFFLKNRLTGARCAVLGTADTLDYVRNAGGMIAPITDNSEYEVVVVGDEMGFDFLPTLSKLLSSLFVLVERDCFPRLVLPNPDIIFPITEMTYGIAAGSVALVIEKALEGRFGKDPRFSFSPLGKPHAPIYERAVTTLGTKNIVMFGDTLSTDILGANNFGIDSVLVSAGVSRVLGREVESSIKPTHYLVSLALES